MSKKRTETPRPVNIKQQPSTEALAEVVATLIRAMERGEKIFKNQEEIEAMMHVHN